MKGILLSDLHLDINGNFERVKKGIEFIIQKFGEYENKPVIFFLGDYGTSPWSKIEHMGKVVRCVDIVASWIKTLRMAGFIVLAVPGNHDAGRDGIFFDEGYSKEIIDNALQESYPCIDRIEYKDSPDGVNFYESEKFTFIGINTVEGADDTFMAAGKIGERQFKEIDQILSECREHTVILYMHHHPVRRGAKSVTDVGMQLVDGTELMALCARYGVRLIVHGHEHSMTGEIMRGRTSIFNPGSIGETGRLAMFTLSGGCFFATLDIMDKEQGAR